MKKDFYKQWNRFNNDKIRQKLEQNKNKKQPYGKIFKKVMPN
jgi:hypothetical protein